MKKIFTVLFIMLQVCLVEAATYYSQGSLAPNLTSSWDLNRTGSGGSPANFTSGDIFVIQNGHTMSTSATWSISGASSKLWIENGGVLVATSSCTLATATTFQIDDGGTYKHNNTTGSGSTIFNGSESFGTTSTVEILSWQSSGSLQSGISFGNLKWNVTSGSNNPNLGGGLSSVNGNLEILSTGASGSLVFSGNTSYTLSIGGDLIISGGTVYTSNGSTSSLTYVINLTGNLTISGGTLNHANTSSLLTFNFTGSGKTFTNTGTITSTNMNWDVNSGASLTLNNDFSVPLTRTLTVNGTLNCGTSVVSGGGGTTVNSAATVYVGHEDGLAGNLATIGTNSFNTGATYVYNGIVEQAISSYLPDNLTGTLKIDNSNGVSLNRALTITTGTLDLTSGNLITRFGEFTIQNLTIGSGASITNPSSNSFIDGPVIMTLASGVAKTFPIGKSTIYRPITLNMSVGQDVTAEMFNTAPSGSFTGIGIDKISFVRYYSVSNATSSNCTATIPWGSDDGVSDLTNITVVYGGNSSLWLSNNRSGGTSGVASSGTVIGTFNNIIGADFTLGNLTGGGNALPVELSSFTSVIKGKDVQLNWRTATEVKSYGFSVERRTKNQEWSEVSFVKGAGNSNSPKQYSFTDENVTEGKYIYRLKMVDNDGTYEYSSEVEAEVTAPNKFELAQNYPNPFNPTTVISYQLPNNGFVTLKVYDVLGKEVASLVNSNQEAGTYNVDFNAGNLSAGTYIYKLQVGEFTSVKKLLLLK